MDVEKITEVKEETTPEERKEHVESSTTIAKRVEKKLDKALNNGDIGAGGLAAALFVLSGQAMEKADWQQFGLFLAIALFLSLVKHRIPEGTIAKWLKKTPDEMLKDATNTFLGRK